MGKLHDYFEGKAGKNLILDDDIHVKLHGICHNLNEHAAVPFGCSIIYFKYGNHYKNVAFTEKDDCITLYAPKEDLINFRVIKIDDYEQFGFVLANFLAMWVEKLPTPEPQKEIKLIWKD